MKDIEIINQIISDKIYNSKVLFDIELRKISDKRLVVGMLSDLFSKDFYNADKKIAIEMLSELPESMDSNKLIDCNKFFIEEIEAYRNKTSKSMDILTSILTCIRESNVEIEDDAKFVNLIKSLDKKDIEIFKKLMLDNELYEVLVSVDKIIKI